ncbi:MAG: DUF3267 domain-containing protein [Anaerolineaceae bacterium]|nr:DUF3267 domain-containing protein [Anaerolineaceae bacterium]
MQALQSLPISYRIAGTLDLSKDRRALLIMNVAGFALMIGFGWLFLQAVMWMRPGDVGNGLTFEIDGFAGGLELLVAALVVTVVVIVLHEAAHGLFFWIYTHSRPVFAYRIYYAYASAPGWYLPRNQYLVTSLAPFVLLTGLGLVLLAVLPPAWLLAVLAFMTFNASGAIGDLVVAIWLIKQPNNCLAQDYGDSIALYLPVDAGVELEA